VRFRSSARRLKAFSTFRATAAHGNALLTTRHLPVRNAPWYSRGNITDNMQRTACE
jgi:hypothetical protein